MLRDDLHVVYTKKEDGWFCGTDYVDKDLSSLHPLVLFAMAEDEARLILEKQSWGVDVVVSPAMGAIPFGAYVALHLSWMTGKEALFVYAEKKGEEFVFRKGPAKFLDGANVAVIEDIGSSGGSAKRTVFATRKAGGRVRWVGLIWNRGGVTEKDVGDVPVLVSLVNRKLPMTPIDQCAHNKPFDRSPGKYDEYMAEVTKTFVNPV